jgi:hypothetical protein
MSEQHTPGPWGYSKCRCGHPVCHSYHINHSRSNGAFDEADARLIAAAPDLLAALEGLFEQCAMVHKHWGDGANGKEADAAQDAGRAAIAKARGES